VLAAGTLVALLLGEGVIRVLGFYPAYVIPDATIGYRYRPRAQYRWKFEGFSQGRMNAAGWRDRDYSESKPQGTTRILIVGDSYVEAIGVPLDSTFHKRLERGLNARAPSGHRVEVIALGRAGLGTTQEYLTYRRWGVRYDPDIVAVLFVLNDCSDNWPWPGASFLKPFLLEVGDSLRLDTSFVDSPQFRRKERLLWLKQRSSLLTLVATMWQDLRVRARPDTSEAGLFGAGGWYYAWNLAASPPADSIPAFRLTEKILARFARDVRQEGGKFVVFVTGIAENEDPALLARRRDDPVFDPDKVQRWLGSVGARNGFDVVPLSPAFRSAGKSTRLRQGYGHWNTNGQAVVTEVMIRYFAPRLPGL